MRGGRGVVAAFVARRRRQQDQSGADDPDRGPFPAGQPDPQHLHAQHGRDHQVGADDRLGEEEGQEAGGQGAEAEAHEVQDRADDELPGHRGLRGGGEVRAAVLRDPRVGGRRTGRPPGADGLQDGSRAVADGRRDSGQQAYEHPGAPFTSGRFCVVRTSCRRAKGTGSCLAGPFFGCMGGTGCTARTDGPAISSRRGPPGPRPPSRPARSAIPSPGRGPGPAAAARRAAARSSGRG